VTIRNLERAFRPRSVAIVGASPRPGSIGNIVLSNIEGAGFRGEIWPVNPKYQTIGERRCYADAQALPDIADLIVVATPPETVPGIVEDFGEHGTKAAVVITAGFGHGIGSLRQRLLDASRPNTFRVLGPNGVGLMVPGIGLNASFAHQAPLAGDIALISQSGAIITTLIDWANDRHIGFSAIASLGDMADVDFGDLIDWFAADGATKAIFLYIEGITDPRKFVSAARSPARSKPLVVIKSGRHEEAARAAASHTGALAGVDAVYDAVFRHCGILRVYDLAEVFDAAETLSRVAPFAGNRLAVLTNGGGVGVLAVDQLIDIGGSLAELTPKTIASLDTLLPATWSRANPVDIIGDAGADRYRASLETLLADETADAILVMNCPTALASTGEAAKAVTETVQAHRRKSSTQKPVFAAWLGGPAAAMARSDFIDAGIPVYATPGQAVTGFMHLVRHSEAQASLTRVPPSLPEGFSADADRARAVVAEALADGRSWLTPLENAAILEAYRIPFATPQPATSPEEASAIAATILRDHKAAAVKIRSPDILHKTDVGGVRLDLTSEAAVADAAREIIAAARAARPEARIDGVSVEPMIRRPGARELIVGVVDDRLFGPVILFGQGGTAVEVIRDKALALPPLDLALARDLIARTRVAKLLDAFRSEPAADIGAVALTLVKLSQLAADVPEIRELDINPLLADKDGVIAIDARIRIVAEDHRDRHGLNPRFSIRPYPAGWEREVTLAGADIDIRPVRPDDEGLYPAFFKKIEPEDMRLRFFTAAPNLTHADFARMTQIDYVRSMAFVAIERHGEALLGVIRIHADPDHERAEFAVLVRSDLKGKGIGWALMQTVVDYARADGLGEIHGDVLAENTTMLKMCGELGFARLSGGDDPRLVSVTLEL
jgi:acetyltransferase